MPGKETMRNRRILFLIRPRLAVMALLCLCSLCIFCGCTRKEELVLLTEDEQGQAQFQEISEEPAQMAGAPVYIEEEQKPLYVHVCGAVMSPGVYRLDAGSRVYEAVQAAGGFAENAEESYVNQAQELPDGVKLVIPTKEEAEGNGWMAGAGSEEPGHKGEHDTADKNGQIGIVIQESIGSTGDSLGTGAGQTAADEGRININTATVEELCKIPGIGATRAAAIVSYREDHGSFQSPEDIMQVSGIKEGTYERIKDGIRVE